MWLLVSEFSAVNRLSFLLEASPHLLGIAGLIIISGHNLLLQDISFERNLKAEKNLEEKHLTEMSGLLILTNLTVGSDTNY